MYDMVQLASFEFLYNTAVLELCIDQNRVYRLILRFVYMCNFLSYAWRFRTISAN